MFQEKLALWVLLPQEPIHLLTYDDGGFTLALLKNGGWIIGGDDGDDHLSTRLDSKESLKTNEGFKCDVSESRFGSKRGLQIHLQSRLVNRSRCVEQGRFASLNISTITGQRLQRLSYREVLTFCSFEASFFLRILLCSQIFPCLNFYFPLSFLRLASPIPSPVHLLAGF